MAIPRGKSKKRNFGVKKDSAFKPSFVKRYDVIKRLGEGGFGVVFAAKRKSDNAAVAVKIIKKDTIRNWCKDKSKKVPLEVFLLKALQDVEGVVKFYDGYNFKYEYLMVMERPKRCQDLFDFVMKFHGLNDTAAKAIFRQVTETALVCASRRILHQDIKLENIIIDLDNGKIKLIDFGLGTYFQDPNELMTRYSGTFYAAPPEWFLENKFNGLKAAVWSLGILLYVMLTTYDPFTVDDKRVPCYNSFKIWGKPSKLAQQLFMRCLSVDPAGRPSLQEILDDPYLSDAQKPPLDSQLLKNAGPSK